jgi:hypothetical protein
VTNPCDENAENTGKSEQWRSTRDRLALIEERLDRRSEEHKVNPCQLDLARAHDAVGVESGMTTMDGGSVP